MEMTHGSSRSLRIAVWVIAVLTIVAALYFARTLFIPITLACILALVLAPIVRLLRRTGLPRGAAAGLTVIAAVGLLATVLVRLSRPAVDWFARLPEALIRLRYSFSEVVVALQDMREFTQDVARLSKGTEGETETVVQGPDLAQVFLTNTGQLLTMVVITSVLLFFLLAHGDLFLLKTVHILPRFGEKKRAVEIGRDLKREVSRYLFTITAINIGLGCITAATMAAFGLPDPLLWGALATTLNFIPYVGSILTTGAILLASILSFTSPLDALLPPFAFIVLTTLEGNIITPALVGRRLTLNPVIVFTSLLVWGWLWGAAGMLLAVPLLVVAKILCDHIKPLQVVGEYLSSRPPTPDYQAEASSPASARTAAKQEQG